jgi:AhpD family alkylhydroperoxidase
MHPFAALKTTDIPAAAEAPVKAVSEMFGFLPNVVIQMAQSPVALATYIANLQAFSGTAFTPVEQQVVLLAASVANRSPYSVAVHSTLAQKVGADPVAIEAIRTGRPIADFRLETLRRFTEMATLKRGELSEAEAGAFLADGFTRQHLVEVIFGIATKTFAHYLQAIAKPELDSAFKAFEWPPASPEVL